VVLSNSRNWQWAVMNITKNRDRRHATLQEEEFLGISMPAFDLGTKIPLTSSSSEWLEGRRSVPVVGK
jgi:hypothetical protein